MKLRKDREEERKQEALEDKAAVARKIADRLMPWLEQELEERNETNN